MFMFTYTVYMKYSKKINIFIDIYQKNNQFINTIIKKSFDIFCHKITKNIQNLSWSFMIQNKNIIKLPIKRNYIFYIYTDIYINL